MKKSKFLLMSLLITAIVVSCSKVPTTDTEFFVGNALSSYFATANDGGNVTCDELEAKIALQCEDFSGFDFCSEKIDYYGGSGGVVGPITWSTNGTWVTWSSTVPVNIAIIIKGGPIARVYFSGCGICTKGGTGEVLSGKLYPPINPNNGKPYGLSNITFCWNECEDGEDLVIAVKSFLKDGPVTYILSSGIPISSSTDWCALFGYNAYPPSSPIAMMRGGEKYAEVTVAGGVVTITANAGLTLDYSHVYVGTLADLLAQTNGGCPPYTTWPKNDVDGNSQTFIIP